MKDSQILSAFQEPALPRRRVRAPAALVFDACKPGVVLRAVVFVEAVMTVGAMFGTADPLQWMERVALLTAGALPATLLWLLAACSVKHRMSRLGRRAHYPVGVVLGVLAGLVACALLASLGLAAEPPWLASASAGLLLSVLLVAGLVLRARGRTPAATAARLSELQARIRPHFLFNTLNSAIALVRAEPAQAEALLEDLADLFRHALADPAEAVSLAQEISLAERYLAIEQVRFGSRLRVHWSLDPAADRARLPPLLLQPLVENAVKHGVEPSPAGAEVHISSERRGATVVIKVVNTVPAGQGASGHGLALDNVRNRLGLLHDVQGQFQASLRGGVFQVRIQVPA
ncbi:sensor histidine kinase [Pseudorhodoferax sp. Leaf267]|uniref:sensor histidine kinase n=1 Tax=Pseudorhodoferax sp. Leaf267 TaxID=1736316 RepID=UPI0006F72087|nr:histidine kinase [Pseudorhodoferax sp. Leaf267]KQP17676.1 histidine kinase [Pseudorhodoferax sp. Leaf267]